MFDGQILVLATKCVREIYISIYPTLTPHIVLEGNSQRPDLFSTFLILGLSAIQPVFEDVDIKGYKQIGGIASLPLLSLGSSFLHAFSRSKSDFKGLGLPSLLRCWCSYTEELGYKPLGCGAMKGLPLDEKLVSFWVTT